jgi:hypothetical protein
LDGLADLPDLSGVFNDHPAAKKAAAMWQSIRFVKGKPCRISFWNYAKAR